MFRPWKSHVPDTIDDIVTRLQAVTDPNQITVRDGPYLEGGTDPVVLIIGFTGFFAGYLRPTGATSEDFGSAAVSSTGAQEGLGGGIHETFSINCASIVRSGDPKSVSTARRLAYDNVTIVANILLEPPAWIRGNVMKATLSQSHSLDYVQDRRGLLVFLPFSIECEAFAQQ